LIEATLLSLSSQSATSLSALAPRSGLERSDFVPWHLSDMPRLYCKCPFTGVDRKSPWSG
jgi:hypothetical protein